jgi:micrococcal nuclease
MLFASLQFIFLSSIQTNSQQDDSDCDSSYPNSCISSPPPNLNCDDVSSKNFAVLPPDPHGFDRDEDGIGCES